MRGLALPQVLIFHLLVVTGLCNLRKFT